jgi:hypothetical protein
MYEDFTVALPTLEMPIEGDIWMNALETPSKRIKKQLL